MKVVFCNDDFGISYGFTKGISECFLKGITTSTAICVNGNAYTYAVKLVKTKLKKINLGLHLNLDYGKTTTKELQNKEGKYKFTFFKYLIFLKLYKQVCSSRNNKSLLRSLEKDLDYQFKKAITDNLNITFVNGHDHIYMIPPIFKIVCKLCKKYGIKYIRLPREPYYFTGSIKQDLKIIFSPNIIKFFLLNNYSKKNYDVMKKYNLRTTDAFYGVLHAQRMNTSTIMAALSNARLNNYQCIEILGHPANINDKNDTIYETKIYEKFAKSKSRTIEKKAFQSSRLKKMIRDEKIESTSFKNL